MDVDTTALAKVAAEADELASLTDGLTYNSAEERAFANKALRAIKEMTAAIDEKEKAITKPLTDGLARVRELFAPSRAALLDAEAEVKAGILEGLTAEETSLQAEAQAAADRGDQERAVAIIAQAPTPPQGFEVRRLARCEVTNAALIPPRYMKDPRVVKALEAATLPDLRTGQTIPGVRLIYKTSVSSKG